MKVTNLKKKDDIKKWRWLKNEDDLKNCPSPQALAFNSLVLQGLQYLNLSKVCCGFDHIRISIVVNLGLLWMNSQEKKGSAQAGGEVIFWSPPLFEEYLFLARDKSRSLLHNQGLQEYWETDVHKTRYPI